MSTAWITGDNDVGATPDDDDDDCGVISLLDVNWSTGLRRVGRAGPTPAEEQLHILRNLDKEVLEESRRMEVEEAKGA